MRHFIIDKKKFSELVSLWVLAGGTAELLPIAEQHKLPSLIVKSDHHAHRIIVRCLRETDERFRHAGKTEQLPHELSRLKDIFQEMLSNGHIKIWENHVLPFKCKMDVPFLGKSCHEASIFLDEIICQRLKTLPTAELNSAEQILKKLLS